MLLSGELFDRVRSPLLALAEYDRAIAVAPRSAAAWNARARLLLALGHGDDALSAATRARELLQDDANFAEVGPVHLTLARCLRAARRLREALALAEAGLARSTDALLTECASELERELALTERERC